MVEKVVGKLRHSIIVSVQADQGEPLNKPECIVALAMSALNGGAKGLRIANPENIRSCRESMPEVPIIGITKPPHPHPDPENHVYITPSLWTVESVIQAGADIVAMDATERPRPSNETLAEIVAGVRERFPEAVLMADIATEKEAYAAAELGFNLISTTLSGYTAETLDRAKSGKPDFDLLKILARGLHVPIILEGRVWHPEEVSQALELGAYAVVIGSAITRPQLITRRFAQAVPSLKAQ